MYSGTFLIVGLAWQGHQSANIPYQDEGGDLSFLEYLTRHVYGRLPCRFFNMSTLMSAAPSYRPGRRYSPSPLHPSDTTPPVTQTGPTGRRAERLNHFTSAQLPWNYFHSTPFPFVTIPLECPPFTKSTLHHIHPLPGLPFVKLERHVMERHILEWHVFEMNILTTIRWRGTRSRNCYRGIILKGSHDTGTFQMAGSLKGYSLKVSHCMCMGMSHV